MLKLYRATLDRGTICGLQEGMRMNMGDRPIIATELLKGQGLGNQLFCYVTTRCLAYAKGYEFSILNREIFANNTHDEFCHGHDEVRHCNKGMYFMDIDCGLDVPKEVFDEVYHEREDRIFLGNSMHDIEHGCYISGADKTLLNLNKTTLLYGNMQAWAYFGQYRDEIRKWLAVKPEYDCHAYAKENLCIINVRGGEYAGNPELFLRRKYWLDAMKEMRKLRPDMEFMIVTDDVHAARRVLPEVEAHHFALAKDYTIIKNASYLILSNSSFAFFPAFTSETVKYIIAPKYWARHNVSDGYWASEQNIYDGFSYMDKKGRLFSAQECRAELAEYKKRSKTYRRIGTPLAGMALTMAKVRAKILIYRDLSIRALRSLRRRMTKQ